MKLLPNEDIQEVILPSYFVKILFFVSIFVSALMLFGEYYFLYKVKYFWIGFVLSIQFLLVINYFVYIALFFRYTIITNQRLLGLHHKNIFTTTLEEIPLSKITKVDMSQKGFFQNYFGYGTLYIYTKNTLYIQKFFPNPQTKAKEIFERL